MRLFRLMFLAVLSLLFLTSCDSVDPGTFEAEYVVESYLISGEELPQVRLSRTAPVNQPYDFTALAIEDATVTLSLLDTQGEVAEVYTYRDKLFNPGVYEPVPPLTPRPMPRVRPLHTYALSITVPGTQDRISATTVVPDTFRVVAASAREVVYQGTEQLEVTVTRSRSPGREQNYYLFVTEALDASEEQLTPFAKALFDQQDGDLTVEELRISGSPLLNEANYDINPDGTLTIKYPWLAIVFYGTNRISANAIDDNLYDYIRSQSVQQGGSTFAPGEIPNPIEHVEGAHGVFGSYARVVFDLVVNRAALSN